MSKRSGKGARSRHQEKRLQEKRARKAANKARKGAIQILILPSFDGSINFILKQIKK